MNLTCKKQKIFLVNFISNLIKTIMKKYLFFVALAAFALASCSDDSFVGENSPNLGSANGDGEIHFGFDMQNATRADIYGNAAATLLGNNFYVMGTKGSEAATTPSLKKVFDNYLVRYTENTAGKTQSNTSNWEYVGVAADANHVKLSPENVEKQTIKYWDYSEQQYDFLAFSTGTYKAVANTSGASDEIGVTAIATGTTLGGTAYTFDIPSVAALKNIYITDITTVLKANYGKEVKLTFKNLASKVRIALYETVPGYAVKDVKFYTVDGTSAFTGSKGTAANLISTNNATFASTGSVVIRFPNMGTNNKTTNANYNKAAATVSPTAGDTKKAFGDLSNFAASKEGTEATGNYLGRTLPTATYAGEAAGDYYQYVFPVSAAYPLTLRVDYTLVSTDGSGEEINVYGAKAVVPSDYTIWQPNYAYTYIFKISDNTNGWTDTNATKSGLFPITFDAVVAEFTDVSGKQTTISTVSTPSITTYQQNHDPATDEYDNDGKDIYVQVMDNDNNTTPKNVGFDGSTKPKLNAETDEGTKRSLLYEVTTTSGATISEATVMDALENQKSATSSVIYGRNGITLTSQAAKLDATVLTIVNGADDNPISLGEGEENKGKAAKIAISGLNGTYAYVYDYTDGAKGTSIIYQPYTPASLSASIQGKKYITQSQLDGMSTVTVADEAVNNDYIYFSKTTAKDGSGTVTYSYVSVDGKETLPAGLYKFAVSSLNTGGESTTASAAKFVFDTYTRNTGKYAVKIIKIVD